MGCDGGTIPRRDELVKVKKKAEVKDKDAVLDFQWRYCYLSQQSLESPVVMCGLGFLYNKVSVINVLLNRNEAGRIPHVKSLKDVKNLNFTTNPAYEANCDRKDGSFDNRLSPYICPVVGMEITGNHRFVALWSCGCVFSERALKEVATTVCHKCQKPFVADDVVVLNGTEEDLVVMRAKMETRQMKNKKAKKSKTEVVKSEKTEVASGEESQKVVATITKPSTSASSSDTQKLPTAKLPATSAASSSKIETKSIGGLLPSKRLATDSTLQTKVKKIKTDYSIAKDPEASDVYKSLFTTHESERQQTRAHWITYNPFYN